MQTLSTPALPIYHLEADELTGNPYFRVYNFNGNRPLQSELLVPHRKDHYLIALIRHANTRQWIDMEPYIIKDNTIYFSGPGNIIVKEEVKEMFSTGIAFTTEFLSLQGDAALSKLPLLENPHNVHELLLNETDLVFVEDIIAKINTQNHQPGEWQQRMLSAYLTVLLTYLSKLYTEQYREAGISPEKILIRNFQKEVEQHFHELHEVGDYAALLHISPGHLSEVVKTQSGKPAIKHIHDRIILEARRLLFHTETSSKEIAYDLGFEDASYFNRFFKREAGVTPAGYRSGIRKMYH